MDVITNGAAKDTTRTISSSSSKLQNVISTYSTHLLAEEFRIVIADIREAQGELLSTIKPLNYLQNKKHKEVKDSLDVLSTQIL